MNQNMGKEIGWKNFLAVPVGCKIDWFSKDDAGYIKSWEIASYSKYYSGTTQAEFMHALADLRQFYNLDENNILTIYIDNTNIIKGFFADYVTLEIPGISVTISHSIRFNSIKQWDNTVESVFEIRDRARQIISHVFKEDNAFFLTPNQMLRKHIRDKKCQLVDDIQPKTYQEYSDFRHALYGGYNYMPYKYREYDQPLIYTDLTSAYIWCIYAKKHFISPLRKETPYYSLKENEGSIGKYKIKYKTNSSKCHSFKDVADNNLEKGEHVVTIWLTDIDLKTLMTIVEIESIECIKLYVGELGYIPKEIADVLIDEFIKKQVYKETKNPNLDIQKATVNGVYGNMLCKVNSKEEFKAKRNRLPMPVQWGIYTVSYCKELIVSTGNQLDGWLMSATDSIVCYDTPKNRDILNNVNLEISTLCMDAADRYEHDFSKISKLGTFDTEYISKWIGFQTGQYAYTDSEGEIHIKGLKDESKLSNIKDVYSLKKLPSSSITLPMFNKDTTTCTIDGKTYTSYGSYFERIVNDEVSAAFYMATGL